MKRLFLLAMIILTLFPAFSGNSDLVVYRTKTGTRYHLDGCSSLNKSKIETTLEEAVTSGLSPCQKCNPPTPEPLKSLYRVNVETISTLLMQVDLSKLLRAAVECVEDGDTIRVIVPTSPTGINKIEPIRLIGVDVPETVHPQNKAS